MLCMERVFPIRVTFLIFVASLENKRKIPTFQLLSKSPRAGKTEPLQSGTCDAERWGYFYKKMQIRNRGSAYPFRYNMTSSYFFEKESTHVDSGSPHPDLGQHCPGHLLRDHMEGRNSTSAARALKFPDGTSAAWYIVTIIGFYGVIFLFRLAINILRKNATWMDLEGIMLSEISQKRKRNTK
ncbi:Small integral membrane protein 34A [Manis javanica]|nr:Small integral membrane protein 34A [Manis javanica]